MAAVNNTARFAGGQEIRRRWADLVDPKPEETRTPEEVITDLREKMKAAFGR